MSGKLSVWLHGSPAKTARTRLTRASFRAGATRLVSKIDRKPNEELVKMYEAFGTHAVIRPPD